MAATRRRYATPSADYADPADVADVADRMTEDQQKCYGLTRHPWVDVAAWVDPETSAQVIRYVCSRKRCQHIRESHYKWGATPKHRYRKADDETLPEYGVRGLDGRVGPDGREAVRMLAVERTVARYAGTGAAPKADGQPAEPASLADARRKRRANEPTPITAARGRRRANGAKTATGKSTAGTPSAARAPSKARVPSAARARTKSTKGRGR